MYKYFAYCQILLPTTFFNVCVLNLELILLHSEWSKLYGVIAILSAKGLIKHGSNKK